MASVYEYITRVALEEFTEINYAQIDPVAFSEAHIEMHITTAEELINGFLGVSTAQTVTNAITVATKYIAGWTLNQALEVLGYGTEDTNPIFELTWDQLIILVKDILPDNSQKHDYKLRTGITNNFFA